MGVWVVLVGRWSRDSAELASLAVTVCVGSRAGYREFLELQRRGEGVKRRGKWVIKRGFDSTRVGLSRGVVNGLNGVLGQEVFRKPHFLGRVRGLATPVLRGVVGGLS